MSTWLVPVIASVVAAVGIGATWFNQKRQLEISTATLAQQREMTQATLEQQRQATVATLEQQRAATAETLAHQGEQERLKDARALRDTRRERMRAVCTPVAAALFNCSLHPGDETAREMLKDVLLRAATLTSLELDTEKLRDCISVVYLQMRAIPPTGVLERDALGPLNELHEAIRQHLAQFDEPLG